MKRLTVLTVVLASLTVITGVYGMNFQHMPELNWRYGYLWALALMVAVPSGIVLWARKKKWL
jgi:magnesium transporter